MSRKNKRRRLQQPQGTNDGFEFLDDRAGRAPVAPAVSKPLVRAVESTADAGAAASATVAVLTATAQSPEAAPETAAVVAAATPRATDEAADPTPPAAAAEAEESNPIPAAPSPTLGEALVAGREARRLSLEQASARTRIGIKMLQHLEADRFDEFAADAYVRGTVRAYGTFLGLDVADLVARYEAVTGAKPAPTPIPLAIEATVASASGRRHSTRALALAGAVVVLAGAGYAGWRVRHQAPPLRPQAGLAQIETELRHAQSPPPAPAPVAPASAPAAHRSGEDTAPGPLAGTTAPPLTDLVAVTPPSAPPVAVPVTAAPARDTVPPPVPQDGSLVLTATANGPCSLRLVTDGSGRRGVLFRFERAGESRSWTARRSFRLVANRGANLDLTLNGRAIATPADGRAKLLDRSTLDPKPQPAVRRSRPRAKPRPQTPPPAPAIEPHSGMLPPY